MARHNKGPRLAMRRGNWSIFWTHNGKTKERRTGTADIEEAKRIMQKLMGPDEPSEIGSLKRIWQSAKHNAKMRGMAFEITTEDVMTSYRKNHGKCAVTGIPFDMSKYKGGQGRRPWVPSIDRIDSAKPYTTDNIRIVCVATNLAMNWWGEDVLARLAKAYVSKRGLLPAPEKDDSVVYLWQNGSKGKKIAC